MKKINYLFAALAIAFTACTPLEDVYDELDAQGETPIVGDATVVLSDDDYKSLKLDESYFETEDEAKDKLPAFIEELYPVWGEGSSVIVNYNLNNVLAKTAYTLMDADYAAVGLSSLETEDDFNTFLDYKFAGVEKGSIVDLTYKASPEITDYELTDADYTLVGDGRFKNFDIRSGSSSESEEARRVKIQTILLNNFPNAVAGDKYEVTYKAYDGGLNTLLMLVELTENTPANLTDYTLVDEDYALVGNGNYKNFDIRAGRGEETIEVRRSKIETILLNNFSSAVVGDIYNVTYDVYDGSNGTRDMLVEFDGTNWNLYNALTYELYTITLVEKTSRFVLVNNWQAPYVLVADDYRAMEQRYDNFNGRNDDQIAEANRIISIYLGQKYPYAAEGDFMSLQYDAYAGSGVTNTLNVNFTFNGSMWNAVPEVIESTLQFGYSNGEWVADNTIKYTLTAADYNLVGNGNYGNFDVRSGKDEETVDARLAKINTILLNNFPNDEEGQKYVVSYAIYNGSNAVWTMKVIKEGSVYILNE